MRRAISGVIVCAAVTALSGQAPVFRSTLDFVTVDVSVRQGHRPVTDLTPGDFEVLDNGHRQDVAEAAYASWPIEVTLVTDLSLSVEGGLLVSLKRAIDHVGSGLRPTDRIHLVGFNHVIGERPSPPAGTLLSGLLPAPAGATALFDAVIASAIRPRDPTMRPMLIVFTDGADTMSFLSERTLTEVSRRVDTAIFIVAVGDATPAGVVVPHARLYETLAASTGGAVAMLSRAEDLGSAFLRAVDSFRASYVLRYAFDGPAMPGWHDIAVRVTRPGRYDIRARNGYVAARP